GPRCHARDLRQAPLHIVVGDEAEGTDFARTMTGRAARPDDRGDVFGEGNAWRLRECSGDGNEPEHLRTRKHEIAKTRKLFFFVWNAGRRSRSGRTSRTRSGISRWRFAHRGSDSGFGI